jgi:predicted component of viral defense system (DUF524 family)
MDEPKPVDHAFIECFDDLGDVVVRLEITPLVRKTEHPTKGLYEMDPEEAADEGLSVVQLEELCKYTYKFKYPAGKVVEGFKLAESKLVSQYSGQNLIETGSSAGHWTVQILDSEDKPVAKGSAEIRSSKMDYLQEYRGMIKGISREIPKYLYELGAATDIPLVTEWSDEPPTLQQQVEFLRAVLGGREFRTAMMRIIRMPHERLEQEPEERSVMRAFKPGRSFQMQVAKGGSRVAVPLSHPLHARMPSLPSSVTIASKRRTLDTPENRFVKYVLRDFSSFLDHAEELLNSKKGYEPVIRDLQHLRSIVARYLGAGMFKEVAEPRSLPLGSQVLQKRGGYREVLQHWLQFKVSSRLKWDDSKEVMGGDKEFPAGKRDLPALYEAWLFLKVLELFRSKFGVRDEDLRSLINERDLSFTLNYGKHAVFRGVPLKDGRRLQGELNYNRTFLSNNNPQLPGSWTQVLRPDFTMSFWTGEGSLEEAEARQDAVHVHFDAKYRVHTIEKLFGTDSLTEEELREEKKNQWSGNYKRADLMKMHAYRDAIRRSEGAYVLYPGSIEGEKNGGKQWQGFHEILPGLGAFAIKPNENGEAQGIDQLSKFLDQVMEQLANRASFLGKAQSSRWDAVKAYERWTHLKEEPSEADMVWSPLVDHIVDPMNGPVSAHDIMVIIGWCKNEDHLAWINKEKLYNFRVGAGVKGGIDQIEPQFAEARMIVLHNDSGALPGVWKVRSSGVQLCTQEELQGYPSPGHQKYAVFGVQQLPQYTMRWNKEEVVRIKPELNDPSLKGVPAVLSLAEFLRASPMQPDYPEYYR